MIRRMVESDFPKIYELGNKLIDGYDKLYDLKKIMNDSNHVVYVFTLVNNLLGFIEATVSFDEADIVAIIVAKEFRNQTIGNQLLNTLIQDLHLKKINVEVRESNSRAIYFYLSEGFEEVRKIKNYYGTEDALFMVKEVKDIYILAIESSCDETSVAIVRNGKDVVSLVINTQISTHENYGGVVPEIASRLHTENITIVLNEALKKANMKIEDMSAIAVTYGPGLLGSLLVGVETAKTLALLYDKPLIAVNHMAGHIYANNLEHDMKFPSLALVISGGHTDIVYIERDYNFKVLGSTLDDAIGEAYDKVARVLGLKYPGGPNVEKLAKLGRPTYKLPSPMSNNYTLNMSFSGLKSSIINLVHNEEQRGNPINKNDLACSFQTTATEELIRKLDKAIRKTEVKNLIIAGGVSANQYIRGEVAKLAKKYDINLTVPKLLYCTDNAAMIGAAAYPLYIRKIFTDVYLDANPTTTLY